MKVGIDIRPDTMKLEIESALSNFLLKGNEMMLFYNLSMEDVEPPANKVRKIIENAQTSFILSAGNDHLYLTAKDNVWELTLYGDGIVPATGFTSYFTNGRFSAITSKLRAFDGASSLLPAIYNKCVETEGVAISQISQFINKQFPFLPEMKCSGDMVTISNWLL